MPAPAPRVWEVRTTTANESSTMQGCEDPRPRTEKGLEKRPPMESDGEIDTIVVEGFEAAFPGEHCSGE